MNNLNFQQTLPSMPQIVLKILKLFMSKHTKATPEMILNMLISKLAFAMTTKRIQYKEIEKPGFPNWYALIFAVSGCGKDSICNELDNLIFKNFYLWLNDKAEDYNNQQIEKIKETVSNKFKGDKYEQKREAQINNEIEKIRPFVPEVYNGTAEGIFEEAKVRSIADFGSIFIKMSEFSKYFLNSKTEDKQFFSLLFIAYEGKFPSKCTKGDKREKDIIGVPLNCLLMCDPSLFDQQKARQDLLLDLHTGFARRAVCSFVPKIKLDIDNNIENTLDKEKAFFEQANKLNEEFFKTFIRIENKAIYKLSDKAFFRLREYRNQLYEKANNIENELLRKQLLDLELTSLKLSTLYAALNHIDKVINFEDMEQAISTVEFLSKDFEVFLKYKPKFDDGYDRIFNFFVNNLNKVFKKTELTHIYFKEFGYSRKAFRREINEIFDTLVEIAPTKGYFFKIENGSKNSTLYSLHKMPENKPLNGEVKDLDELLNRQTGKTSQT